MPGSSLSPQARALRRRRMLNHAAIFLSLLALLEAGSALGWLDPLFFPAPSEIIASFWRIYVTQGNIWYQLYVSLGLVLAGFTAGSILGVGLGAVVGMNATVRRFLVGPKGCEVTGVTLTPDYRTMFVNIQHPGEGMPTDFASSRFGSHWPASQWDEASRARPRSATLVVTREDGGEIGA